MNRTIALFVALVILLAHCLAIYTDGQGHFAFAYDPSYVALRLAHNLIFEGQLRWNPGMTAWESYPSPLWVAFAAVAERLAATDLGDELGISVNTIMQSGSIVSALLTVVLAGGFRSGRAAGLIAPLLLVSCGCVAAAAANGMETALYALLVTSSFLCFERGYGNRLAISMTLLCLVRPEAAILVAGLLFLRFFGFPRGAQRPALWPFVAPLVTVAATTWARWRATGFLLPPSVHAMVEPHPGQAGEGFAWLLDSMRTAIGLILLVYAIVSLARRHLSGTGTRALFLALLMAAALVLQGRAPLPFAEALVPALPLAFVAAQEGMIEALDGPSVLGRRLALSSLFVCIFVSALASRHPADLGPLPLEAWHGRWMRSRGSSSFGYEQTLGRQGLEEQIATTLRLRGLGLFVRDYLDPSASLLTPWPGSLGYLSRLQVFDLLGRASPIAGATRPAGWTRRERSDVVAALDMDPDFVVPEIRPSENAPSASGLSLLWLQELDRRPLADGRLAEIQGAFSRYEMVTVPITIPTRGSGPYRNETFRLLRRKELGLRPRLEIGLTGRELRIGVSHRTHLQIADLRVLAIDTRGRLWSMRPTGELAAGPQVLARPGLLLYESGTRSLELLRLELPDEVDGSRIVEVRAVLRNPGVIGEDEFADVSAVVVASL
ncbi:MAG: hypothetical protein ACKVXR_12040 [Planctomycetota bacterium]